MLKEFKEFAVKGNMIDMAVGIIIGGAFNSLVSTLVNDVIMPLLSILTGKIDFSNIFIAMDGNKYAALSAVRGGCKDRSLYFRSPEFHYHGLCCVPDREIYQSPENRKRGACKRSTGTYDKEMPVLYDTDCH